MATLTPKPAFGTLVSQQDEFARQAEALLIASDATLYRDLTFSPRLASISPTAWFAVLPFFSAFVDGSRKYVEGTVSDSEIDGLLRPHESLLRSSRLRFKLLDDNRRTFDDIVAESHELAAINSGWFASMHSGLLAPIWRMVQTDLGLFFLDDQLFCTTHIVVQNLGLTTAAISTSSLSIKNLGPYMGDVSYAFGKYLSYVMKRFGGYIPELDLETVAATPRTRYRDVKSRRLYKSMVRPGTADMVGICVLLTSVLSAINTARTVVPTISVGNEVSAFKIKLVSLYHAVSAIQKIVTQNQGRAFLDRYTADGLNDAIQTLPNIGRHDYRRLRNTLVHYGIDKRASALLNPNLPLYGLVEACVPDSSFFTLVGDVENGLNRIAERLGELLLKGLGPNGAL
jgi:hypothetical protein